MNYVLIGCGRIALNNHLHIAAGAPVKLSFWHVASTDFTGRFGR